MARVFFLFMAAVIGVATYIGLDCYLFNFAENLTDIVYGTNRMEERTSASSSNCTSQYYYRKRMDANCSFNVYLVQIGKLLASSMNESEIEQISDSIEDDLIQVQLAFHATGRNSSQQRREWFRSFFRELHSETRAQSLCHDDDDANRLDFFRFIQNDLNETNDPTQTDVNFFNSLPMKDILNDSTFVAKSKHKYDHIDDYYFPPKYFSYTLSVDSTGYLPSLQLRFAEICNEFQHKETKHVTLNRNQVYLLWAGEMYYYYDYKHRRYVLVMDNSSGHWKPDADKIPKYLEAFLYAALFPEYNVSQLAAREDLYDYTSFYRPLILVGHSHYPWHDLKHAQFPLVDVISEKQRTDHLAKIKAKRAGRKARNNNATALKDRVDALTKLLKELQ